MAFIVIFVFLFGVLGRMTNGVPLEPSDPKLFIIGGEKAPLGHAAYMVALIFGVRAKFLMCGGSLIARSLVLTAAHCIDAFILEDGGLLESFRTVVGSNKWNSGGTVARVKDYYIHPNYDADNIKFDAGVLVLQEKVELSDRVAVIKLGYDFVDGNVRSFVTGWGRTGPRFEDNFIQLEPIPDDLQILYINTMDHEQCQQLMTAVAGNRAPPVQRDIEICTFHSWGHGMCVGDSGSALVRASTREQIGIVSWGYNCARGAPDVYVRTHGIRGFLEPVMEMHED